MSRMFKFNKNGGNRANTNRRKKKILGPRNTEEC